MIAVYPLCRLCVHGVSSKLVTIVITIRDGLERLSKLSMFLKVVIDLIWTWINKLKDVNVERKDLSKGLIEFFNTESDLELIEELPKQIDIVL